MPDVPLPTTPADDGSALSRLERAVARSEPGATRSRLAEALAALSASEGERATALALDAARHDDASGLAWYVLAVAQERAGDFSQSLQAYQAAVARLPDDAEVANDLGRLAARMGMTDVAEQLFRHYLAAHPGSAGAASNLAAALRDLGRGDEAIAVLKGAIQADPGQPLLWNTLGTVLSAQGDMATAITFFDEALRLTPAMAQTRYNRATARLEQGDAEAALADCEQAIADAPADEGRAMMALARATMKLALGRIGEGWDDYEAEFAPLYAGSAAFDIDLPRWTPQTPLAGKTLLVMGEQGLGDEVLFANMLPDVIEALGPDGKLLLAVEARLVPLFQRSFPEAEVVTHATHRQGGRNHRAAPALAGRADLWVPIASLARRFRRELADFPDRQAFLSPDPARVAHWRAELAKAPAGRKVGILWKSMRLDAARARFYSPFQLWAPVLRTPGVTFVNVQYGDCQPEIDWAARELGVEIWTPPGIDLKQDLDDIAALTCALDLTVGFANATSNISAACGAPTWIISVPGAWPLLGLTERMAWYPAARVFLPRGLNRWEETMADVAAALQTA